MIKFKLKIPDLKSFLDEKVELYNQPKFIETDPISIPHRFTKKEDIEIAGFFAATIAWGQRKAIITNADKLMRMMDESPYDFIVNHSPKDLKKIESFVHRTFNGSDCIEFISSLKKIYTTHSSLENIFLKGDSMQKRISAFHISFSKNFKQLRTAKHISNPAKNSSAKRLNMYLRWMVRNDKCGVDFGIWKKIKPSELMLPLDVHTGTIGRKLGLLKRKQDDWKSVEEITAVLRSFNASDPVKYDFALFGLGAFEKF